MPLRHASPSTDLEMPPDWLRWETRRSPSAPMVAWEIARFRHRILHSIEAMERDIVELVDGMLWRMDPFEVLAVVRTARQHRVVTLIVTNAIVAASHAVQPSGRARCQVEFLATACPTIRVGVGWLRRLDSWPYLPIEVWAAAPEVRTLLEVDERTWGMVA